MTTPDRDNTAAASAVSLRSLLVEIDAGRIDATTAERAYLAGAADAAERLAGH